MESGIKTGSVSGPVFDVILLLVVAAAATAAGYASGGLRCAAASLAATLLLFIASLAGVIPIAGPIVYHLASGPILHWYTTLCPMNPALTLAYWVFLALSIVYTIIVIIAALEAIH